MLEMKKREGTNMNINIFNYFVVDAFKSLKRNKTMSIASIITIFATLFIFGFFVLVGLNVNNGVENLKEKIEVKVYMKDDISLSEKNDLHDKLVNTPGVTEVTFESKAEALDKAKHMFGEFSDFLEGYEDEDKNPLPTSYTVRLSSPEDVKVIISNFETAPGVENIGNDQDFVDVISRISETTNGVIIVLLVVLSMVSVFLIVNTIRLTVFSRRKEIGIMKFVGATDWFIRWPLIIEGIVIGLIGAIIANLTLYFAYKNLFATIARNLVSIQLIQPSYILSMMSWQFIVAGMVIGIFGSIIALRRFLKV